MWEPTGKLLIAYTMYNSTRCYGIPYTYTVVSLCDRCFSVAVRGKGIILTSTTQNKLEIKILLTVKSSMTSILSVWEHYENLQGNEIFYEKYLTSPSSAPCCNRPHSASLDLVRDLKGLFKFRGRGIFPREFPLLIVVLVIRTTAYRNIIWDANRNSSLSFLQEAKNRTEVGRSLYYWLQRQKHG